MDLKLQPLRKAKKEIVSPPKAGEVIEGKILVFAKQSLFVDLGPQGIGIVFGQELNRAKDYLKELKIGDKILAKVTALENEEGYRELSLLEASKEFAWKELQEKMEKNEELELKVKKANKGGLIFEASGIQGFLPASQLSAEHYPRVKNGEITEIAKTLQKFVGQIFKVRILDFDPQQGKLIFSEKGGVQEKQKDQEMVKNYSVGQEVEGEIVGVTNFGAFVKLEDGLEALLSKSELSENGESPNISAGQKIKAKIINIEDNRIYLSLK